MRFIVVKILKGGGVEKRVVIYGGSGGIGSATARKLRSQGYELHLIGRSEKKLALLADELNAGYTVGDVNEESLFKEVSKKIPGPWCGLLYCIGTINLGSIRRLTSADFIHDFTVNAVGAALAVKYGLSSLKKNKSTPSIVLFSSVAASQGFIFHSSVAMAKGAVKGLTLSLAAELAPKIRVNAIAPSLTRTALVEQILSNEQLAAQIKDLHALKRLGAAEDAANIAAFLISQESSWITGQIIGVDGGRSTLRTDN